MKPLPASLLSLPDGDATPRSALSLWEECDRLDTLFVLFCCAACWLVIPAIGMAYSGYSLKRNG